MYLGYPIFYIVIFWYTIRYTYAGGQTVYAYGNKLFYSNGTQFLIKGVAYQSPLGLGEPGHYRDPLADREACNRDLRYFLDLGINTIRVYTVDPENNHDYCMEVFGRNGIYVLLDLSEPRNSIISTEPSWNVRLFWRYSQVIDAMHRYSNLLGFFAGNEVILDTENTHSAAYVKAAIRDVKSYIKKKKYRRIPVGYAANDHEHTRIPSANYFACGDPDSAADFFGINIYEWCEPTTYETSGYRDRVNDFKHYNIPIFFSEYGCNIVNGRIGTRTFKQVEHIYSEKMTQVFSGGIVYEWFQNVNNYGLVNLMSDNTISPREDYKHLKEQIGKIKPKIVHRSEYRATNGPPECPAISQYWSASTRLPPIPNSELCACASRASSCIAVNDITDTEISSIFSYVCGEISCKGVSGDGRTGVYGAYSVCEPIDQLNIILHSYYIKHRQESACNFKGLAYVVVSETTKTCSSLLRIVGMDGSGSITGPPVADGFDKERDPRNRKDNSGKTIYANWKLIFKIIAYFFGIIILTA
ncbi:hypothetical protein T552_02201 [Pneumocystis carinii B80]|uniref:1,3-beta-glucanosyltransferase n=1 Tax=Pneumocystis carinii (strain B80) TaxID=1408658 RepID=A0A0W4ZHB0_PNEC8|nr:hypothetical protein T552_02201 [Pneumocystis carinii B80]KTW27761.1 hypothetical protein T552_02201 [Pneumocystis carinii B80]